MVLEDIVGGLKFVNLLEVSQVFGNQDVIDSVIAYDFGELILTSLSHPSGHSAGVLLYHGEVFDVVVSGEQQFSGVEFCDDAADRPDVAELIPLAALEDYFWRTVLSCIDDGTVSLCPFGGPTEIDYLYFVSHWQVIFLGLAVRCFL